MSARGLGPWGGTGLLRWLLVAAASSACGRSMPVASTAVTTSPPASATGEASAARGGATTNTPWRHDVDAVVETFRQIIVLVEDGATLPPADRPRASIVARVLFHANQRRLADLSERYTAALDSGEPTGARELIDILERDGRRDADRLAFADLVDELAEASNARAASSEPARALLGRAEGVRAALLDIKLAYNGELAAIFGRFDTRGPMPVRESWNSYLAFLRSQYSAPGILTAHADAAAAVQEPARDARRDSPLEINGARLPEKTVALTFDDGPHWRYTERIREILARYQVPAVFFHVGENVGAVDAGRRVTTTRSAAVVRRLVADGHTVANHSHDHELLSKLSDREIGDEIDDADRAIRSIAAPAPLFRPPYGARNEKVLAAVQARKLTSVLWNIDSQDWADPIPQSIANRVVQKAEAERRGIVLFHDIHARTIEALPSVIETLHSRGYRFAGWNGTAFIAPATGDQSPAASAPPRTLYRQSWAVVIGIDQYRHWPKLSYAANDARALREALTTKLGFPPGNVTLLVNEEATRDRILAAIGDALADPSRVAKDDRVFVFFAGHGATRTLPNGRSLGYLVPVEADLTNYQSQAISMTQFQDVSEAIPAKHVLFVMDACYSGIAATRGGSHHFVGEMARRTARQILTAGGADQQVADGGPNGHSIFTWTLLQGLDGRADLNSDRLVTASELAAYVGPAVSAVAKQTPAFASLPGSDGGEFLFPLAYETEYLSAESRQLDEEGITLNAELELVRAALAEKQARNAKLRQDLAAARAALGEPSSQAQASQLNDTGTTRFRERRYAEALEAFHAAAALDPSNALVANNVGFAYHRLERYSDAIEWFTRAIGLDARRAIAFANLGDAQLALGRPAEARRSYERFLELQPTARYAATVRDKLRQLP